MGINTKKNFNSLSWNWWVKKDLYWWCSWELWRNFRLWTKSSWRWYFWGLLW